ncbi:MAG: tetratricopeptide repeat protein, partial [Alphaproteobacteria bacterium]|nr:tetratricopeptide repeat protein [Alphaproteobacteria bacterium]
MNAASASQQQEARLKAWEAFTVQANMALAQELFEQNYQAFPAQPTCPDKDYIQAKHDLAAFYHAKGDLKHSLALFEGVLADCEHAYRQRVEGVDEVFLSACLNDFGALWQSLGEIEVAQRYYQKAYDVLITEDQTKLGFASCANNMGRLMHDLGDLTGCQPFYETAHEIYADAFGDDYFKTAESVNNIGTLLDSFGDLDDARIYLVRAL